MNIVCEREKGFDFFVDDNLIMMFDIFLSFFFIV